MAAGYNDDKIRMGGLTLQPAFKRKWRNCLIFAIIALSLSTVATVIQVTGVFERNYRSDMLWITLACVAGAAVMLTFMLLSLRFSYLGRRYAAVVFSSFFGIFLLARAAQLLKEEIRYMSFRDGGLLVFALSVAAWLCLILLTVDFYVFSHIAPRYNGRTCGLIALIVTLLYTGCRFAVIAVTLVRMLNAGTFTPRTVLPFVSEALYVIVLTLVGLALAVGMGRARRAKRTPIPDPSMFPALDEYRASLRKERA